MKKRMIISIILVNIILIIFCFNQKNVQAATGSFSIKATSSSIEKGKTASLTLTAKNCAGQFTISSSDSSIVSISTTSVWIDDENTTITLTAKKEGTATITVTATNVADNSEEPQDVSGSKSVKIKVTDNSSSNNSSNTTNTSSNTTNTTSNTNTSSNTSSNTTNTSNTTSNTTANSNTTNTNTTGSTSTPVVSTDATLKNLGITPRAYDFSGFRRSVTSYSVKVPNDLSEVYIYAYANDSNAKVSGIGTKSLKVGENTFSVKVTAEDNKTTKTYTLTIIRLEETEDDTDDEKDNQQDTDKDEISKKDIDEDNSSEKDTNEENVSKSGITNIEIEGVTLTPSFNEEIYTYNVSLSAGTTKANVKVEKSNNDIEYEVVGNDDLKDGKNYITILVYNGDITTTYQIVATVADEITDTTKANTEKEEEQAGTKTKTFVIEIILVVIGVLLILFIISKHEMKKNMNSNISEKEDEDYSVIRELSLNEEENENDEQNYETKNRGRAKGKRFK